MEIELLCFKTLGSFNRVKTLCELYYSKVAMCLKLDIVVFVKLFWNDSFFPCIQILIVSFYYTKRPTWVKLGSQFILMHSFYQHTVLIQSIWLRLKQSEKGRKEEAGALVFFLLFVSSFVYYRHSALDLRKINVFVILNFNFKVFLSWCAYIACLLLITEF